MIGYADQIAGVFDYKPQYNDYEYLERAKEWQTAEDKEESDD